MAKLAASKLARVVDCPRLRAMKVIGLTGGIGSGKSAAAAILRDLGAIVLDADTIAHELYAPGTEGWQAVVEAFGHEILDSSGAIERKKLAAIVFADASARRRLEAIMHPRITAELQRRLRALQSAGNVRVAVVEAALLLEAGWQTLVDEVWVITAAPDIIRQRLERLRGMTTADIEARQRAQMTDEARRAYAHAVIDNSGTLEQLREQLSAQLARDC